MSKLSIIEALQQTIRGIKSWLPFGKGKNITLNGEFSAAFGEELIAGAKGFQIIDMSTDRPDIQFPTEEKDKENVVFASGWYKILHDGLTQEELNQLLNKEYSLYIGSTGDKQGVIQTITNYTETEATLNVAPYFHPNKWTSYTESKKKELYNNSYIVFDSLPNIGNVLVGTGAFAFGYGNKAIQMGAHAEGSNTLALGKYSHAEGVSTEAHYGAHAEGINTKAIGNVAHAEGYSTTASGLASHAEGNYTEAAGDGSHTEGYGAVAEGTYAHAEGTNTKALGSSAHAEGLNTSAEGNTSHAEGNKSKATGNSSHAEGTSTQATGDSSHAEGNGSVASGQHAHAEGSGSTASGKVSHAEGNKTVASGGWAHAEGHTTTASGSYSHAEGRETKATKTYSHAGGYNTIASAEAQTAIGKFNKENTNALFIVGNGSADDQRNNAFEVQKDGRATVGADPTKDMDVATKKYVDGTISTFVSAYIEGDGGAIDKLQEIADWIDGDKNGVADIIADVNDASKTAEEIKETIQTHGDIVTHDAREFATPEYVDNKIPKIDHLASQEYVDIKDSSFDKRITNIEQHLAPKYIVTDETTVYAKEVPAKACPYAQIDKLSTASENPTKPLLGDCVVYYPDTAMFENGEASFSFKTDSKTGFGNTDCCIGKFTAGDTSIEIYLDSEYNYVPNGTKLIFYEFLPDASKWRIEVNVAYISDEVDEYGNPLVEEDVYIEAVDGVVTLYIESAGNNLVSLLSVMAYLEEDITLQYSIEDLEEWRANHPSLPEHNFWGDVLDQVAISGYFKYPNAKVTALEVQGANMIKFPYKYAVDEPYSSSGLTYTVREDGGIRVFGVATKSFSYEINDKDTLAKILVPDQTYTLSGCQPGIIIGLRRTDNSTGASSIWLESSVTVRPTPSATWADGYAATSLYIYNGSSSVGTYIDTVIYPVLNESSSAYPYGKYCRGKHTLWEVPKEIQALEGYGEVIGERVSYIDFENKKFINRISKVAFDGTEKWKMDGSANSEVNRMMLVLSQSLEYDRSNMTPAPIICGSYRILAANDTWLGNPGAAVSYNTTAMTNTLRIVDMKYQTLAEWKAHLAELYANGTPLVLEYVLLEPVETDISAYLPDDNLFDIEGAKSIDAVNEGKNPVSSSITYMLKEV